MTINDEVTNMLKSVAKSLNLVYAETPGRGGGVSFVYGEKILVMFASFVEPDGRVNIVATIPNQRMPLSWGQYKADEIADKAKFTVLTKTRELMEKK
ncbi:MAG TPA: hypothetical protein ENN30_00620 [Candidatus Woesearchaeota archaeon]|nr:hypothetical protein [Candidatus Woesearchaeota archaeon]